MKFIALLIPLILLAFIPTMITHEKFDEKTWSQKIAQTRMEDLFAVHAREGVFFNPWLSSSRTFLDALKWKLSPHEHTYSPAEETFLPAVIPDTVNRLKATGQRDFILWVGHNTFLMRLSGEYWITDPMFSQRALLPKRKTPPAITAQELNALTGNLNVIISHNHYDHLDTASIQALSPSAKFYVPLGLGEFIKSLDKTNVYEMDWWQEKILEKEQKLVCLPTQHWSRRIDQDRDTTLWASFLIITPSATVYCGGDSGYFAGYKEVGKRYKGIDYALLPTTAYHPRWFMHYAHMNIEEALRAFEDLKARNFIPTQWGTFQLGDEPAGYPALDLRRTIRKLQLDPSAYIIMSIGQILTIKSNPPLAGLSGERQGPNTP